MLAMVGLDPDAFGLVDVWLRAEGGSWNLLLGPFLSHVVSVMPSGTFVVDGLTLEPKQTNHFFKWVRADGIISCEASISL